ncbi:hypothetical protein SD427_18755 (plasmid) [Chryseobacterium sp. JJR-5R]|uniref:hypothetical protein n=1 Tax=Chryseobacterium sp. JJR-5R TaxID=3093923 RepID=UPI002A75B592|nr:hypothetical protein [Chryseobacterium sp. JJR-5R]WPO84640.1 hypothetical protein SD427_18755 [Chryseobacterium sp. JJR-5R]
MKHYKLPFSIRLDRKYNEVNIEKFLVEREEFKEARENRMIEMDNDVHIEYGKFQTYNVDRSVIMDLALRYAMGKQEFRKLAAQVIDHKKTYILNKQ